MFFNGQQDELGCHHLVLGEGYGNQGGYGHILRVMLFAHCVIAMPATAVFIRQMVVCNPHTRTTSPPPTNRQNRSPSTGMGTLGGPSFPAAHHAVLGSLVNSRPQRCNPADPPAESTVLDRVPVHTAEPQTGLNLSQLGCRINAVNRSLYKNSGATGAPLEGRTASTPTSVRAWVTSTSSQGALDSTLLDHEADILSFSRCRWTPNRVRQVAVVNPALLVPAVLNGVDEAAVKGGVFRQGPWCHVNHAGDLTGAGEANLCQPVR